MTFDPAAHLQKQGWEGHGAALQKGGRARPLTAVSKRTSGGLGHGSFDATPWWDDVYKNAAKSKKGKEKQGEDETAELPVGSVADAVAAAKMQGARRTLYSTFMRGEVLAGSESETTEPSKADEKPAKRQNKGKGEEDAAARAERRRKRRAERQQAS